MIENLLETENKNDHSQLYVQILLSSDKCFRFAIEGRRLSREKQTRNTEDQRALSKTYTS